MIVRSNFCPLFLEKSLSFSCTFFYSVFLFWPSSLFDGVMYTQCLFLLPPAQQVLSLTHCSSGPFLLFSVWTVSFAIISLSWFSVFNFQPFSFCSCSFFSYEMPLSLQTIPLDALRTQKLSNWFLLRRKDAPCVPHLTLSPPQCTMGHFFLLLLIFLFFHSGSFLSSFESFPFSIRHKPIKGMCELRVCAWAHALAGFTLLGWGGGQTTVML